MFILDFGSGNTCKNDPVIIKKMIDGLAEVDPKRKCIIKWQLFMKAGNNKPLAHECFNWAKGYAHKLGFKTTASVFDIYSLDFLLSMDVPFVKIANRQDLYYLIGEIPRKIPVIMSGRDFVWLNEPNVETLCCISKYPAHRDDYFQMFKRPDLHQGISDHTTDWELFKEMRPAVYECHYKLPDSEGLDAGTFARTPKEIKEIYKMIL